MLVVQYLSTKVKLLSVIVLSVGTQHKAEMLQVLLVLEVMMNVAVGTVVLVEDLISRLTIHLIVMVLKDLGVR